MTFVIERSPIVRTFDHAAGMGIRRITPLIIPGLPFGFVLGLLIEDAGLPRLAGWSSSWIIFAGSSQLAALELLADSASATVVITSVFLINSRHAMYSAALRDRFATLPRWFRFVGPYFLTDQLFAVASTSPELVNASPRYRMSHYLGAGITMWSAWQIAVLSGLLVGNVVREEWALSFAAPILFLGLMIISISDKPGLVAAIVGAGVALAGQDLPQGSGLLLAIITGMTAGGLASAYHDKRAV